MTSPAPAPIDSPQAAVDALCAQIAPVGTERVPLAQASGRALAEPLLADRPSPAADVSAMDGYAVNTLGGPPLRGGSGTLGGPPLRGGSGALGGPPLRGGSGTPSLRGGFGANASIGIAFEVRIGEDPGSLPPGACAKIVTGAAIPRGADAVIRREDTDEFPESITIRPGVEVRPGANIRRRGENCPPGATIVDAGAEITAPVAAALAAFGAGEPLTHRPLQLAILVTGDELRPLGEPITDFQLRDSNGPTLEAMFAHKAWIGAIERGRAPDAPEAIRTSLAAMLQRADAAIITGGVSMGDHDHVPDVVRALGAEVLFHKLPQRPGKPMLGAVLDGKPILALPGNPVSVMVTARRIALPVLRRLAGFSHDPAPPAVTLASDDGKTLGLWWHRLVRLGTSGAGLQPAGTALASLITSKGSGDIPAAAGADGFVEIPPGQCGPGPWPYFGWAG